ncbi:MAG: prepilin-type N-terminal cleavage/methylation domain-containing protein [Sulfurimonas sp.]|jgi:prepilin-type N-terminal cleavage/methylation domain-containing protein
MRKAFSLIELLIVIVIIGVVYTLAVGNFQKIGEASTKVKLENLKEYLQTFPHAKDVKLLCLDDCSKCTVMADGEVQTTLEDFLDASVKVYDYNFFLGVSKHPQEIYFNKDSVEEKVCFSYSVDKKGLGEQVLIEFNGAVYDFSTYLTPVNVYKSLQEAMDAKEKLSQEVLR